MGGLSGDAGRHSARRISDDAGQDRFLRKDECGQKKYRAEKEQWPHDDESHGDLPRVVRDGYGEMCTTTPVARTDM